MNEDKTKSNFSSFLKAETLEETFSSFQRLLTQNESSDVFGIQLLSLLKENIREFQASEFLNALTLRHSQDVYQDENTAGKKVAVIGAGPAGLRAAIEASFLGCKVVLFDKRRDFSRHNVLHIWPSTIADLKTLGAKTLHSKLCVGSIDHISIRKLQVLLFKVALVLGVKFYFGSEFQSIKEDVSSSTGYRLEMEGSDINEEDLEVDVLIGADGERSKVSASVGFERRVCRGSQAIGITFNLVNTNTREERNIEEFGISSIYNQQFFKRMKENDNIQLENLVYYRDDTHYFVTTAKKDCLLQWGVLLQNETDPDVLLRYENINQQKLEEFARKVADNVGLPSSCSFITNSNGQKDVQIFDFSRKFQASQPAKILQSSGGSRALVILVGDALVEPFWPQGTGANRAIHSAMDAAWMIKQFFKDIGKEESLLQGWEKLYRSIVNMKPSELEPNVKNYTINPETRYSRSVITNMFYHSHIC